jgi:hypothetical protein
MKLPSRQFWIKAAVVAGALILPFGTLILVVVAAVKRARHPRQAEWWKLWATTNESPCASSPGSATPEAVPVRVD